MIKENKTYIWSLPTRIFHWSLALFILVAWISADDDFLQIHSAVGYALIVLALFRLLWAGMGPKYSHFRDLNFNLIKAVDFSKNVFTSKEKHLGHNPAASLVMSLIIIVTLIISVTGILTLGAQEAKGVFSSLNQTFLKDWELFEGIHELTANLLLVFIFMHLAGVASDKLLHGKDETLNSIITGYKNIKGESIKLNLLQKILFIIFFVITILIIYFTFTGLAFLY